MKQRGIITWTMLLVIIGVGASGLVVSTTSELVPGYATLTSCLQAVDSMNGAMSAMRTGETPGTARIEWKFRCLQVGAP